MRTIEFEDKELVRRKIQTQLFIEIPLIKRIKWLPRMGGDVSIPGKWKF